MNEKELVNMALDEIKALVPGIAGNLLFATLSFLLPTLYDLLDSKEVEARAEIQFKAHSTLRSMGIV